MLHEFVVMPDHIHLLITPAPAISLEKAMQYIKGGFSFRAKKELIYLGSVWQPKFDNDRSMTPWITSGTETISIKIQCAEA